MKKLIYQLTITTLFLILSTSLSGQDEKPAAFWNKSKTTDFRTIQSETEGWFEGKDKGQGTGYKQWKRWEAKQFDHLTSDGQITNYAARNHEALQQYRKGQTKQSNRSGVNTWSEWGANNYTNTTVDGFNSIPGTGVLNCVAFHPTDPNTLFVGGPATGLWKTTDHGSTWSNLTDGFFTNIGISSIVVNKDNPNIIHIMTGDGDGQDTYSIGIWITLDGGNSWLPTSLTWNANDMKRGFKLVANEVNSLTMLAATSDGLYRTEDGVNWTHELGGLIYDVVYSPGPGFSNFVFASTEDKVFRSINGGADWTEVLYVSTSGLRRIQLAVTAQNPSMVYAMCGGLTTWITSQGNSVSGFPGLYVTKDFGTTWGRYSETPALCVSNIYSGIQPISLYEQTYYNLDIAVSPTDPSRVTVGAINLFGSSDTAKTWTPRSLWFDANPPYSSVPTTTYVHADIHALEYNPLNNRLYCANDGGIYFSNNDGINFTDLTIGLNLNQFNDIAGTPQNSNFMLGGLYHNGSRVFTGGAAAPAAGSGDGSGCMINYMDQSNYYVSSQNGSLRRTDNAGGSFTSKTPNPNGKGTFVSNFTMNPTDPNIIYAGWKNDTIYLSIDKGDNWVYTTVPGIGCGTPFCDVQDINVASDGLTAYACTKDAVFKSTDAGASWSHLFSIFIFDDLYTSVRPHPLIPEIAIITQAGYAAGEKVYYVNGTSVTNISYDLPNVPVHCSVIHATGTGLDDIYIGTDIGVFKKSIVGTSWTLFDNGMPNAIVKDLEIYQNRSILRAATFGRGLWETDITCIEYLVLDEANDPNFGSPVFQYNQAGTGIYSTRKVTGSNGDVTYKADNFVILDSGFLATEGNKVIVGTAPCGVEINE
jgi:hypothetical protein